MKLKTFIASLNDHRTLATLRCTLKSLSVTKGVYVTHRYSILWYSYT